MTQDVPDTELIARVRAGQLTKQDALSMFFERYNAELLHYLDREFPRDKEGTQDAAQTAWRNLIRTFDKLPPDQRSVFAWLCTTGWREANRRRQVKAPLPQDDERFEGVPDRRLAAPEALAGRELDDEQATVLERLTEEQRHLIYLKAELELTHDQIAERLGIHKNTVKYQLTQIRKALLDLAKQRKVSR